MLGLSSAFGIDGSRPVEVAGAVGARGHAVPAADAPVVVDDHDAVRLLPGGPDRADLRAGRVRALLARDRHVEVALLRDLLGRVVGVGVRRSRRPSPSPSPARGSTGSAGRATGCSPRRRRTRSGGSRCSGRGRGRSRTAPRGGRGCRRPSLRRRRSRSTGVDTLLAIKPSPDGDAVRAEVKPIREAARSARQQLKSLKPASSSGRVRLLAGSARRRRLVPRGGSASLLNRDLRRRRRRAATSRSSRILP